MKRLLWLLLSVACAGCGNELGDELAARQEKAELVQLAKLKGLLTANNNPLETDVQVFIGKELINQVLAGIGEVKVPMPQLGDATLTFSDVKVAFKNGYPLMSLKAVVDSPQRRISAAADATALLILDTSPNALDKNSLQLIVTDLAPKVRVWFWQSDLKGFWRDLARQLAQDKLDNLPGFSIPLSTTMPFALGGPPRMLVIPTGGDSNIGGPLALPSFSPTATLTLRHVLFLQDGVHLYLSAEVN